MYSAGAVAAGESETITILVDKRDLASYDAYGGCR